MGDPLRLSPLPPHVTLLAAGIGMTWTGLRLGNATPTLCGLTLLAICAVAHWISAQMRRGIAAGRRHQPRVFEDESAHVEIRVENRGPFPITGIEVRDTFPPAETHRVHMMDRRVLRPRRGLRMAYRRDCVRHRGLYTLGPLVISGADPAGLFPFEESVPIFSELHVYPQAVGLHAFPLLGEGTLTRIGEEILAEPGDSVEFRGVREWRPSDGRRGVHWPTSARLGRLMAKEYEQDVVTEVTIVLDLRRAAQTGLADHSTLEYAVKAAASIAQTAIERQHLVQLWGLGSPRRCHVPFGGGAHHLHTLLDELTLVRADGEGTYAGAFGQVLPTLRRGATLVPVLSAAAFDVRAMEPTLRALALDGVKIVAVVIDDRSFPALYPSQFDLHREAADLGEVLRRLRSLGASVFTIAGQEDVHQRLEAER
ncbi:DUF58 domain-containing protein [Candidatus Sumerlaeota bacterium]|nr:DUF58 domain-containing protein [Candidatus Sumerlaeota bacterium]